MCTAVLSIEADAPVLLAGVRDELVDRAWQPPGRHWPGYPGLIGGRDLLAGGTWLAVSPAARRVACVLNGRGRNAPAGSRRSRGVLPLQAAAGQRLERARLADFDPFHLLSAQPEAALLCSWDGERLTERKLTAGLHIVVNSGLDSDLLAGDAPGDAPAACAPGRLAGDAPAAGAPGQQAGRNNEHELARLAQFRPRLGAAVRPSPRPGRPVARAWGDWLPLMNGDGISPADPRALILRRDLGAGRIWGTTSISLVALSPEGVRYDFTGSPGDPAGWYRVPV
jgi:Transport and Golgi organisation 2